MGTGTEEGEIPLHHLGTAVLVQRRDRGPGEQGQCRQRWCGASPAPGHHAAIAKKLPDDAEQDATVDVTVARTGRDLSYYGRRLPHPHLRSYLRWDALNNY